jgi:hypothetical protein
VLALRRVRQGVRRFAIVAETLAASTLPSGRCIRMDVRASMTYVWIMHTHPHPNPNYGGNPNWVRGVSQNPTGWTRTKQRTAEIEAEFRRIHGRAPTVIEMIAVRNAGALAARVEGNTRISADDAVRLTNTIGRVLARLGLNKPEKRRPAKAPSLSDMLSRHNGSVVRHE